MCTVYTSGSTDQNACGSDQIRIHIIGIINEMIGVSGCVSGDGHIRGPPGRGHNHNHTWAHQAKAAFHLYPDYLVAV